MNAATPPPTRRLGYGVLGKQGFFNSIEERELAFGLLCLLRGTRGGQRMCRRAGRGVRHLVVSPPESVLPGPVLSSPSDTRLFETSGRQHRSADEADATDVTPYESPAGH